MTETPDVHALVANAKRSAAELARSLAMLETLLANSPPQSGEESMIVVALAQLHAIRNGYALTEATDESTADYIEGKIEGLDSAIETLERRGAAKSRGRKPTMEVKKKNGIALAAGEAAAVANPRTPKTARGNLSPGERAILIACAARPCSSVKLIVTTGYARESVRIYTNALRAREFLQTTDGKHQATAAGVAALGDYEEPVKGASIDALPEGERKIFDAIAAEHPRGISAAKLRLVTTYAKESVRIYTNALRRRELITRNEDGHEILTDEALSDLPKKPQSLGGAALRAKLLEDLPEGERVILGICVKAYPRAVAKADIEQWAEYARESVRIYTNKLKARGAVVIDGDGVKASPHLF